MKLLKIIAVIELVIFGGPYFCCSGVPGYDGK